MSFSNSSRSVCSLFFNSSTTPCRRERDSLPERIRPSDLVDCNRQRLQFPLRFPLAGAQRLQLDCAAFLEGGQIVETAPGMLDRLLPDADLVSCRTETLLELCDVLSSRRSRPGTPRHGPRAPRAPRRSSVAAEDSSKRRCRLVFFSSISAKACAASASSISRRSFFSSSYRSAGLPLEGTDLALDLADDVGETEQVGLVCSSLRMASSCRP